MLKVYKDGRLYLAVKGFWDMGIQNKSWDGGHVGDRIPGDTDWHSIALTMDKGKATLYVDGKKTIQKDYTDYTMNKRPLIGALNKFDGIGYFFTGVIDEVRVWNKALTEAEIQDNIKGMPGAVSPEHCLATIWGRIKK